MAVFEDREGRDWHVDVDVLSLRRVRNGCEVDLLDVTDESAQVAERLTSDPVLLVGVLYEVCRPEIAQRGMSATQFGQALSSGEVIDQATTALLESLANFTPSHRGRAMAQTAVATMRNSEEIESALKQHGTPFTD